MIFWFADAVSNPLWDIISKGGALGVLAVVLWAIMTGRLVPSRYYDAIVRDRDEWKALARSGTNIVEKAVEKVGA